MSIILTTLRPFSTVDFMFHMNRGKRCQESIDVLSGLTNEMLMRTNYLRVLKHAWYHIAFFLSSLFWCSKIFRFSEVIFTETAFKFLLWLQNSPLYFGAYLLHSWVCQYYLRILQTCLTSHHLHHTYSIPQYDNTPLHPVFTNYKFMRPIWISQCRNDKAQEHNRGVGGLFWYEESHMSFVHICFRANVFMKLMKCYNEDILWLFTFTLSMNMTIFQENILFGFLDFGQNYWNRQQKEVEGARKPPPQVGKEPNSKHLKEQGEWKTLLDLHLAFSVQFEYLNVILTKHRRSWGGGIWCNKTTHGILFSRR